MKEQEEKTLIANVPNKFAEFVKKHHKEFNVKLKSVDNYFNNWKTVEVKGTEENLLALNKLCEKLTYGDI